MIKRIVFCLFSIGFVGNVFAQSSLCEDLSINEEEHPCVCEFANELQAYEWYYSDTSQFPDFGYLSTLEQRVAGGDYMVEVAYRCPDDNGTQYVSISYLDYGFGRSQNRKCNVAWEASENCVTYGKNEQSEPWSDYKGKKYSDSKKALQHVLDYKGY